MSSRARNLQITQAKVWNASAKGSKMINNKKFELMLTRRAKAYSSCWPTTVK